MGTVAEIVARVQRRVIDLPAAVSAESQKLVEEAHREIQDRHNFGIMERRETRRTTAGSPSLGFISADEVVLGSGLFQVEGGVGHFFKEYLTGEPPSWRDDSGHAHFLTVTFNEQEVQRAFNQDSTHGRGQPRVLLHKSRIATINYPGFVEWKVYPVPDGSANTSDGEYPITIPYWRYLPFPTTNDWFTNNAEQWLVCRATAEAFALNWDEAKHLFWLQRAMAELQRVIARDKRLTTSGMDTLVPYTGVNAAKVRL